MSVLVYEIDHLTKVYTQQSRPANDDISFEIRQGEIFGLLGDNGAGKSTLVKQMANLLRPTSGSIRLMGRPVDVASSYWAYHSAHTQCCC